MASAQEGSRNSTLNNAALALGHLVGARVLSEKEVCEALLAACGQNGLAKEDRKSVQATIRSGLTAGIAEPTDLSKIGSCVQEHVNLGVPGVPRVPANVPKDLARNTSGTPCVPGVPQTDADTPLGALEGSDSEEFGESDGSAAPGVAVIPIAERPCFRVFDRPVLVKVVAVDPGKLFGPGAGWFYVKQADKDTLIGDQHWICSPLHVIAQACDERSEKSGAAFGRVLRYRNTLDRWGTWTMPMEMLGSDGSELRGILLDKGVKIDPTRKGRDLLSQYLQQGIPEARVMCSSQIGWYSNTADLPDRYVLPDTTIGEGGDAVVFQSAVRCGYLFTTAGSLKEWQDNISVRAIGNPTLMVSISSAFAGPLMLKCNAESGGVHYYGSSSIGKSSLLDANASVWGGPGFKRSWRATSNGMEGAAALSNDSCLALDEISECDPRDIGAVVYALANGVGKQRAGRTGHARPVFTWRTSVVSSVPSLTDDSHSR